MRTYADLPQSGGNDITDRRSKRRFPLRCPVFIQKKDPINPPTQATGETLNVSSLGFYGVVDQSFQPGEHLDCELKLPVENSRLVLARPKLRCNAVVLRVEERGDGRFGLACMITNYSFAASTERDY
jgi:hypothetical protein